MPKYPHIQAYLSDNPGNDSKYGLIRYLRLLLLRGQVPKHEVMDFTSQAVIISHKSSRKPKIDTSYYDIWVYAQEWLTFTLSPPNPDNA